MFAFRQGLALAAVSLTLLVGGSQRLLAAPPAQQQEPQSDAPFIMRTVRGEVVFLVAAVQNRFGVKAVPEARQSILAVATPEGEFLPLFEDVRGRAFRKDKRLRGIDLELLVRQYEGSPLLHVIRVFAVEDGKKYELDYWCEICAIAMFELKACDCCQGPIELRRRLVEDGRVLEE
ncbi:MAG: hypothetical protein RIC55_18725 [Pirellulaceae bacterium]